MALELTGVRSLRDSQNPPTLANLQRDLEDISIGFQLSKRTAIVVVNEDASKVITTNFLTKLFRNESQGRYDVRTAILGHTQQGGRYAARNVPRTTSPAAHVHPSLTTRACSTSPSPLDRILATDFAAACVDFVESQTTKRDPAYAKLGASFLLACLPACLPAHVDIGVTCAHRVPPVSACVGMVDGSIKFTPFEEAVKQMDHVHRRPVKQQWMPVWSLFRSDIAVSLSLSLICSLLVQILNLVSVLGKPGPTWYMAEHVGRLRKKDGTSGNRVSCLVHT